MKSVAPVLLAALLFAGTTIMLAQEHSSQQHSAHVAQVVALDECDPDTFNVVPILRPDFCRSVAAGGSTPLSELFDKASKGTPDPGWDFEPDALKVKEGTDISVVNQGGEPHTFTEVAEFGGGFIDGLNAPGEQTVPECSGGFKNIAVARTRIVQGSQVQVTGLSKGKHRFQCCIHPWMRMTVDVK